MPPVTDERDERLLTPRFVLIVVVGLAYFLSITMLLPVLPVFVTHELGGGDVAVGLAVGAFSIGAVLLRPIAGRIGDRHGRRVLIIGGAFTVSLAVALYHLAASETLLVACRLLGGVGEAAFFVGAGTMVADLAPEARRGEAISYWSIAIYGGLAAGPVLGQALLAGDDYARVWTVSAVLAAVAGGLACFTRETAEPTERPAEGWPPLISRAALAPGTVLLLGMVGLAGFVAFLPLYAPGLGVEAGTVMFVYGGTVLVVRIAGARLPDRLGPLLAGTLATGLGAAGLAVMAAVATPAGLYGGTLLFSMGMSLLYPSLMTLALTGVPERERGAAVGTISSFFDGSQFVGAVTLGGVAALAGYRGAFLGGALTSVAGLVLLRSGVDPRVHRPVDHDAAEAAEVFLEPEP